MGSISTIDKEEALYDCVYKIATDALKSYAIKITYKDTKLDSVLFPREYVYLDQVHGAYEKRTLTPNIYDVEVELLCEINVGHGNISAGRKMSKSLQRAFHAKASSHGMHISRIMATDVGTTSGRRFAVSITLLYMIRMVQI